VENRGKKAIPLSKAQMSLYFEERAGLKQVEDEPDKELEAALDHWINNPLISPTSKVKLYEEDLAFERKGSVKELTTIVEAEINKLQRQIELVKTKKAKSDLLTQIDGLKTVYYLIIDSISSTK
jgi:hypothetical protein